MSQMPPTAVQRLSQREATLTAAQLRTLAECEDVTDRGLHTFVEVGQALLTVQRQRLYRDRFPNFDAYCRHRWALGRRRAYQLMEASSITAELCTIVHSDELPANECQARKLGQIHDLEARRRAWKETVELTQARGEQCFAKALDEVMARYVPGTNGNGHRPASRRPSRPVRNGVSPAGQVAPLANLSKERTEEIHRLLRLIGESMAAREFRKAEVLFRKLQGLWETIYPPS